MTTLDQPNKTDISILKPDLSNSVLDEFSRLQLLFPWMPKTFVDEHVALQRLFPWLSTPLP
jgi:hypothetical protein